MNMADTALSVQHHWSRLRPLILAAIPVLRRSHDEADLIAGVLSGHFTFWPGEKSFVLAALQEFPRLKRCHIFLANGDEVECRDIVKKIEAWAKTKGASQILSELRPALDRKAIDHEAARGWRRGGTAYLKEI